jgi:hypothetical protein
VGTEQAPLSPATYDATWGALEGAAGALAAEVLEALAQGDAGRAHVAARGLVAVVEACAGVGEGQAQAGAGAAAGATRPALAAPGVAPPQPCGSASKRMGARRPPGRVSKNGGRS